MAKGDRGGKSGSAGGSRMSEAERRARLQRFLELDTYQNEQGDEVVRDNRARVGEKDPEGERTGRLTDVKSEYKNGEEVYSTWTKETVTVVDNRVFGSRLNGYHVAIRDSRGDEYEILVDRLQKKKSSRANSAFPKTATSIADATTKADSYVRRMNVGDSVKVGAYTYTKMNSGKFSYKETGGGYRYVSEGGLSDAIVDSMKIRKRR